MAEPVMQTTGSAWTNASAYTIAVPEDCVGKVSFRCYASDHEGNAGVWQLDATLQREGDGAPSFVGIGGFVETLARKTLGAATWDVRAQLGSTNITFDVRGGIGQTVDWLPDHDGIFAMEGPLP